MPKRRSRIPFFIRREQYETCKRYLPPFLGTPEDLTPVSVLKPQPCYDALNALSDAALPFPKHEEMLRELNKMSYKVNLWEHAYVNPDSPIFEDMKPYAGDHYVWDGLVPDFNTEGARRVPFWLWQSRSSTSVRIPALSSI